ncbi:MAG: MFS transporter, partial [Candidatus ainarchaeum sp.]|nr:MFS transporter [Candidatus ainarchaeum sp.]
ADEIGTKTIAFIYSASNLVAIALYALVISPLGFAAANLAEGVRASGFWAITRTEVLQRNGDGDAGRVLAHFSNMRQLADGAGRLFIGFILAWLAFQGSFILFFALSLILLVLVLSVERGKVQDLHVGISNIQRIFKPRPKTFWQAAILQALVWLPYNMLIGFVIPVYFVAGLGLSYMETGGLLAILSLAIGGSAVLSMRWHLHKRTLLLLTLLAVPAIAVLPFAGANVLLLLLVVSLSMGASSIIAEYILADQIYRSRDVSTDIGMLYAPLKVAEFTFLGLGGLVIAQFGYAPLFFVCALSIGLFALLAGRMISGGHWTKISL